MKGGYEFMKNRLLSFVLIIMIMLTTLSMSAYAAPPSCDPTYLGTFTVIQTSKASASSGKIKVVDSGLSEEELKNLSVTQVDNILKEFLESDSDGSSNDCEHNWKFVGGQYEFYNGPIPNAEDDYAGYVWAMYYDCSICNKSGTIIVI